MEDSQFPHSNLPAPPVKQRKKRSLAMPLAAVLIIGLLCGGLVGYSLSYITFDEKLNDLQMQIQNLPEESHYTQVSNTEYFVGANGSLSDLYAQVKDSVVVIQGLTVQYDMFRRAYYSSVQGSGFVYDFDGQMVVITNNHVVEDVQNITVSFINGNAYPATVLGADPYADLAVLSADAPDGEFTPLEIVDSSTLNVGDTLIAVGGPYGLAGTMTTGIVSALGRTISEDLSGGYPIANVIQTTTPINAGNSGGPLLNSNGQVVGITTAIVSDSQGLGFAIPSSTVLREISDLISEGSYNQHPTIGASGTDMNYEIAQVMNVNVTYGWLIAQVTSGGPADNAGIHGGTQQTTLADKTVITGGDIIIAINNVRITSIDDLSTYLEQNTTPGDVINVTIVRENQTLTVELTVGTRPATI
ncbi:MAG: trypsin-like peptidase domain-containing protein [Candidatus Bathyarchaeota archaeon]|nr:trypsin-like peptidase domain-containing protein [Candidatus Bathyarchaeota archaeon]